MSITVQIELKRILTLKVSAPEHEHSVVNIDQIMAWLKIS